MVNWMPPSALVPGSPNLWAALHQRSNFFLRSTLIVRPILIIRPTFIIRPALNVCAISWTFIYRRPTAFASTASGAATLRETSLGDIRASPRHAVQLAFTVIATTTVVISTTT